MDKYRISFVNSLGYKVVHEFTEEDVSFLDDTDCALYFFTEFGTKYSITWFDVKDRNLRNAERKITQYNYNYAFNASIKDSQFFMFSIN